MFETGRRSAISTSELGLYSDRRDRYNRNRYGPTVRKYVIGVMVVIAIILTGIFLYDFTSAASSTAKANQETKHIYILQNALKKSNNVSKKTSSTTSLPEVGANTTEMILMQDRSDDEENQDPQLLPEDQIEENVEGEQMASEIRTQRMAKSDPEFRSQNLNNFKLRRKIMAGSEDEENARVESKQLFDNHAVVYRVRQKYKQPLYDEEFSSEESRPAPFHFELRTPHPTSFKRPKYPQLSQYRYPQTSRNIQDIIKYLTHDAETPNRGIKFAGVYVNPKKYDLYPETGEMMSNSDRSEEQENSPYSIAFNADPLYQYKPKHPADVNLLATSNVRFSPSGINRYNTYYDPLLPRPASYFNKQQFLNPEQPYDNAGLYTATNFGKKRKPKPFSVMLDIYPITEPNDQGKRSTRPRPAVPGFEDYDSRRPTLHNNRGSKLYASAGQPIPVVAIPSQQGLTDEEERQQMVFHLNLYPRKKNKLSRQEILQRSESIPVEDRNRFVEEITSPFDSIAKELTVHSAVEESKFQDRNSRYEESQLDKKEEENGFTMDDDGGSLELLDFEDNKSEDAMTDQEKDMEKSQNTEGGNDKSEYDPEEIITATIPNICVDCGNSTTLINSSEVNEDGKNNSMKDIDTVDGFQEFADGLMATD